MTPKASLCETREMSPEAGTPVRIARRWPVIAGVAALVLVVMLGAVIRYANGNRPFGFELAWMARMVDVRTPFWTGVAMVFNYLGGGIAATTIIPLVIIAGLILWVRLWAALYYTIATLLSPLLVELLKNFFGRPRPPEIIVNTDFGAYPSGHSANAALIVTTLGIVFWRTWIWVVGAVYTIAMMLSRTYLGAHWITDTIAGVLVGAGIAVLVWAPFADRLARERAAPHPLIWRRGEA